MLAQSRSVTAAQVGATHELAQMQLDKNPVLEGVQLGLDESPELETAQIDAAEQAGRALAQQYSDKPAPTSEQAAETGECCADANPICPPDVALVVLILNIVSPGIGSIVSAYYDPSGCNCKTVTFGILQMLLTIVIVGWVWSILMGLAIYSKSNDYYMDDSTSVTVASNP